MKYVYLAAIAVGLSANPLSAFQVTGGEVDLNFSAFLDDADVSSTSLQGSIEAAFSRSFGGQFDLGITAFGEASEANTETVTLHGIFHLSGQGSIGLFIGADSVDAGDAEFIGVEAGAEFDAISAEAYAAIIDGNDDNGSMFGVLANYQLSNQTMLSGKLDRLNVTDDLNITRLGFRVTRDVTQGVGLYAEIGSANFEAFDRSESEPYLGIGANFTFGAARGTTFGQRGVFKVFPGL